MVTRVDRPSHSTNDHSRRERPRLLRWAVVWCCAATVGFTAAMADDLEEAANLLRTGRYEECEKQASEALQGGARGEDWHALKIRAEMARGKYEEALKSLKEATLHYPESLTLYLIGRDVRRFNDLGDREKEALSAIERYVSSSPRRYATQEAQVALGRFFLICGADPKKVL